MWGNPVLPSSCSRPPRWLYSQSCMAQTLKTPRTTLLSFTGTEKRNPCPETGRRRPTIFSLVSRIVLATQAVVNIMRTCLFPVRDPGKGATGSQRVWGILDRREREKRSHNSTALGPGSPSSHMCTGQTQSSTAKALRPELKGAWMGQTHTAQQRL